MKRFLTMCLGTVIFAGPTPIVAPAFAESDEPVVASAEMLMIEELPYRVDMSQYSDPVMDRMIAIDLLGQAVADGDASVITDVALQLAEAERTLHRKHAHLTSSGLLQTAMKVAQKGEDKETLDRLAEIARSTGNDKLNSQLQLAANLGGASRAVIPPPSITVNTRPEQLVTIQSIADSIELAENAGDVEMLTDIQVSIDLANLPQDADVWLKQLLKRAQETTGEGGGETSETLSMLAGASRGWWQDATGTSTPAPIRKIAPNGISWRRGPEEDGVIHDPPNYRPAPKYGRPAYQNEMRGIGYQQYGNNLQRNGNQFTYKGKPIGNAQRRYNSTTGQYYYDLQMKNGTRVIQQSNGQVWARPR
ncbi:hypothetical protein [Lignipirellula cremea]|uniref:Uncharacterized protein n=1 Tax=Lignipirellula cremea TaxID=2528010 RepID=A0A518DRR2_9BACT|nr:hypothetical protein [Lignipirellula cremea]QDU94504.1 hypothetical protein Pla8534_22950 [Lignipirellula cremea]